MESDGAIACVIYAAKSTEDRHGSIPGQLEECRATIATHADRSVRGEYVDEAFSAYTANRGPGLLEAMQHVEDLAEQRGIAELWVQHSDRLARGDGHSARHTVEIALWALKRDVKIRSLHDPDTFRDLLYAVVTGQRNHEDSRRRGLASQAGRMRAAIRGDFIGYMPDGYRLAIELDERRHVRKRMEIDPERQEVIETMFRLALAGERPAAIARAMNSRGWYTKPVVRGCLPARFKTSRLMALLANPRYAGLAVFGGEIVARGHWPAYITESEHERLRAMVRQGRPTKAPRQIEPYLLARLATCGLCGARLFGATGLPHRDGTFARRYICIRARTEHAGPKCPSKPIEAGLLEGAFVTSLRLLLLEPRRVAGASDPFGSDARRELLRAVKDGDEERIEVALERMFIETQPQLRASSMTRRRTHELDVAGRFEDWGELERTGRTEDSRARVPALNRILRDWFADVRVSVDETRLRFVAERRPTRGAPLGVRSEAQVKRRDWMRYAPLARRPRRRYRSWTKAEIVGAIQAWADEYGRSPSFGDLVKHRGVCPSAPTVSRYFGSVEAAVRAAGLTPPPPRVGAHRIWLERDIVDAIRDWTNEHGRAPRPPDWRHGEPQHPVAKTVVHRFGSWTAGLAAAGLVSQSSVRHRQFREQAQHAGSGARARA